ncbi:DUF397 domain-containing protein [Streptomyces hygroscopicus subsp. hygroscopicus]|uniref:DUF397 domain-containing protein n=1 Tax=Streptomyces hygroscopicus TaxID=1912 RepID=UPI001C656004|nr:DUF397 domain-containing protein [Streptomyces hygroscopicus]MBW8087745.1 DUF397 domain-containing protein [Streptomyces hygroscopicus subsp. hygroscopicus]
MTPEVIGPYRKSSYSGGENNCVEVADMAGNGRSVRDSKDRSGPYLAFTGDAWHAFILDIKAGKLDR